MRFIDLVAQQQRIRKSIEDRIRAVLDHGQYIMGPEVSELEKKLADYVGVKHAIGCASGTDALLLALMAYGVGPGDAIITTPFTFMATAEAIALLGAVPVFVDIDPNTYNIDPNLLKRAVEAVKSNDSKIYPLPINDEGVPLRLRGVVPVDLYGLTADYEPINRIADECGLFVIEDAAQSFGAEYKGAKACATADVACTSFFPAKPLGAYGDGGMLFTNDDVQAGRMRSLRVHGQGQDKYDNVAIGLNGRLDTMQAAIVLAKFEIFPEELNLRQEVADRYGRLLSRGPSAVKAPETPEGYISAWAQYSVLAKDTNERSAIIAKLKNEGIPTAIYYPRPLHLQPAYRYLGYRKGDFPSSESCAERVFSLPMHPYLSGAEQEKIAGVINGAGTK